MDTLHVFYVPTRNTKSQMRTKDVTKDCFPPATKCSNCTRKNRDNVTGKSKVKKEYKRCGGCHLFAYCDKDCQREHWIKVHKKHCRLLSGKEVVPNSKHSIESCQLCSDDREVCSVNRKPAVAELMSESSPKTFCHIEELIFMLRMGLSIAFKFHSDGTTCNCPLLLAACEIPFPLGELTGQYVNNLDGMLAHVLKVVRAMGAKNSSHKDNLTDLWKDLVFSRSHMWYEVLSGEKWNTREFIESVMDKVEIVKDIYGATNPWWKTLKFSVNLTKNMYDDLYGEMYDSRTTEDTRLETVKLVNISGRRRSQLRNQATVQVVAVVLPEGTRCQICTKTLNGPVRVTQNIFQLTLEFSGQYPYEPPVVKFVSQMFHPNIDADTGMVKTILMDHWSPARRVKDVLMTLRFLLVEPNLSCIYVANSEAAQLFKENRREYKKRAQKSVEESWPT